MVNIVLAIMSNSIAQILYALSVNRVYGEKVIVIADKMKWWEYLLYGIYRHKTVDQPFAIGLAVSCITITVLTQYGHESLGIAIIHTILLTSLFLTDGYYKLLPNTLVFTSFICELSIQFSNLSTEDFHTNLYFTGLVVFSFGLVYVICSLTGKTMGGGDVKIAPFITMYQGAFILAVMPISLVLVILYAISKGKKSIPYGPFLICAILITIVLKPYITQWSVNVLTNLIGG